MNNNKHLAFFGTVMVAIFLLASCGGGKPNYKVSLKNDTDSASYYLGYSFGTQVANSDIDDFNVDAYAKGMQQAIKKGKEVDEEMMQEIQTFLGNYFNNLQSRTLEKNLKKGEKFLEDNKKKSGVVTLRSGVQYKIIKDGTGIKPTKEDQVDVIYHGTLIDGTVFDSAKERGEPVTFPVGGVVLGFSEALTLMNEGSIWEVYIPAELAYGEQGRPGIPANSVLIFEINLVKVSKGE
jgi:FKBP-type peptidyl-prolyl cis-trans isomerase FklB